MTKTAYIEAVFAPARLSHQPSSAREARFYRDPAQGIEFESAKGKGMQRDIDEVDVLLDLWAEWMRIPELPDEGSVAIGFMKGTLKDAEELHEAADADRIARIDAAFDSLAPIYQEAIKRHYGLGYRVLRFAKDVTFDDAKIFMRVKLVQKGLL